MRPQAPCGSREARGGAAPGQGPRTGAGACPCLSCMPGATQLLVRPVHAHKLRDAPAQRPRALVSRRASADSPTRASDISGYRSRWAVRASVARTQPRPSGPGAARVPDRAEAEVWANEVLAPAARPFVKRAFVKRPIGERIRGRASLANEAMPHYPTNPQPARSRRAEGRRAFGFGGAAARTARRGSQTSWASRGSARQAGADVSRVGPQWRHA